MKKLSLLFLMVLFIQFESWSQGPLRFFTEGRLYFSGDAVRMIMVPMNEDGTPETDDSRVHVKLLNALGTVMHMEEYLVTELGKNGIFVLPEELPTGNYRLIASYGNTHYQVPLHVYEPTVLTSLQQPKNLDPDLGIDSVEYPQNGVKIYTAGSQSTLDLGSMVKGPVIVKMFENTPSAYPGVGEKLTTVEISVPTRYTIKTISSHPDSRISVYFVDQRVVEEHYVDELEWLNLRMGRHYGESRIWAFQFDEKGNKLGPVEIEITSPRIPAFARASDAVPFDQSVRGYLEERKNRKFIDQVYGKPLLVLDHYASEESSDPDINIAADDYTGLASLEEVLNNVVPKTQVIRKNKKSEIRLSPDNSGFRYTEGPFILVNGLPVTELDSLLEIPARQVETVAVFNSIESLRQYGTLGRFGVIEITLKPEANWQPEVDLPMFKGINDLEVIEQGVTSPDLRSEVFWKYIRDGEINWVNPDITGDFIIQALPVDGSQEVIVPVQIRQESR